MTLCKTLNIFKPHDELEDSSPWGHLRGKVNKGLECILTQGLSPANWGNKQIMYLSVPSLMSLFPDLAKPTLCLAPGYPKTVYLHVMQSYVHQSRSKQLLILSVCTHTHVHACIWRPEDNLKCHSSGNVHLSKSLPNRLGQLVNELQGSTCLCFHCSGIIRSLCYHSRLFLETEFRSSSLQSKHFTNWSIPPDLLFFSKRRSQHMTHFNCHHTSITIFAEYPQRQSQMRSC